MTPSFNYQIVLTLTIVLLLASLGAITEIYRNLPAGRLRTAWLGSAGLVIPLIFGCVFVFSLISTSNIRSQEYRIATLTLLGSAVFTFSLCILSRYTSIGHKRITLLNQSAYFDPLTKLYTRSRITSLIEIECTRSREQTVPVSVLMLDIDDFKLINDRFGHQGGDRVLEQLGTILKEAIDHFGIVGRYGGDELVVVLPDTSPFQAEVTAERIRSAVADRVFAFERLTINTSISIGIATSVTFREDCSGLISVADAALYAAKAAGKNKVVHAGEDSVQSLVAKANSALPTARSA